MSIAPASLVAAGATQIRRLKARGFDFDLIDAHYVYPDGVAAVVLGRMFGKPVVVTARGSDITQYPDFAIPRRMIRWAMDRSAALIAVSSGLREVMIGLGAPADKVTVLRNGVDLDVFRPCDPEPVRSRWGLVGPLLLSVGHLIKRKRHHLAIQALAELPGWSLAIIGEGPERSSLEKLVAELGLQKRVIFCGAQPHAALPSFYSAADVLILASSREGWANVLLEAMACGTPVVASNIAGNPEVVRDDRAGSIVEANTAACFATTIRRLYVSRPKRTDTRQYAESFSWAATSQGQLKLFRTLIDPVV